MPESAKTLADQVREIDKLVSDGMEKLAQAQFALSSLRIRLEGKEAAGPSHDGGRE